ncbi:RagB/SusD family protein [Parasegetibacter sp. NRK P23]|uniref:RagB/SusD family protein n=1 Tax=Parasegetibacter sp. NRK P23 TaxID=2942999 RepID=UPI00204315A8|nr:RagB/SusD family protein [Parasegetibacter sp. NRK P23]MCM5529837.1 RagB/SusD family protein [Parasegetibacter sp. NRK P23]
MKKFSIKHWMIVAATAMSTLSCSKALEELPQDELDASQMYRNVYDADAAIIGIYGKFMGMAERYVLLNELRADLLEYTDNANEDLRQLSTHNVSADNPYASPRPFYELIVNCNDVLRNFNIMRAENKMKEAEYQQRYSDVGAMRSFLYLQLGIHFGAVPYVTDPLVNISAIQDPNKFPRLPFNVLLDSLINFTEALPFKNQYPTGTTLNITVDGYPTQKFFINKKVILGDLHLWKGNYVQAATWYREVMETGTQGAINGSYFAFYKLGWDSNGDKDHYISYSRAGDASTLVTNSQWRIMFEQPMNSDGFNWEWVWAMPFDSKFKPENPFIKLFSPIGGSYLVKPSREAMDKWNNEQQRPAQGTPGIPYDARGLLTWREIGGKPVVMKYLYNYLNYTNNNPFAALTKNGKWFLFRQTHLHMRFAEAANRAGKHRLAWGFFNSGIAGAYPAPSSTVTDYQNTLWEAPPFNFDARNSGSSGVPYYRADWYRNIGVRARANLVSLEVPASDSLVAIENGLIHETALENAYEGTRWPDLVRVALRRNDPAYLADKIYDKLQKEGNPAAAAVRTKLMNPENWYLPFKW